MTALAAVGLVSFLFVGALAEQFVRLLREVRGGWRRRRVEQVALPIVEQEWLAWRWPPPPRAGGRRGG